MRRMTRRVTPTTSPISNSTLRVLARGAGTLCAGSGASVLVVGEAVVVVVLVVVVVVVVVVCSVVRRTHSELSGAPSRRLQLM